MSNTLATWRNTLTAFGTLALTAGFCASASAQSCNFSISDIDFGSVNNNGVVNTTATLSYSCSGTSGSSIVICPHIGGGSGGVTSGGAMRRMQDGANYLNYQLYSNSGGSTVWGSGIWPYTYRPPKITLNLPRLGGSASGSRTIYARIPGGQSNVVGYHSSEFSGSHVAMQYRYDYNGSNCNAGLPGGIIERPSFTVRVAKRTECEVSVDNVDFGAESVLSGNIDATGAVIVRCPSPLAYSISLSNGNNGAAPNARKLASGVQRITYGLYRDAARNAPWGSTIGTNTLGGTGNGTFQTMTVFGRVPPQSTPAAGTYTDTVVVTVTY